MSLFNNGPTATSTVITPTSTTGGASSPSVAGDGSLAVGNGLSIGRQGKQDNSVKVGATTTKNSTALTYKVAKGGTLTINNPPPVGNVTVPAATSSGGSSGSDVSGVLGAVGNLVGQARAGISGGTATPVSAATIGKYLLWAAFPVAAFVVWFVFYRKKKAA
ncbi:MAG: hypothetical protein WCS42_27645 [Verrucomicrobiota bacterium]